MHMYSLTNEPWRREGFQIRDGQNLVVADEMSSNDADRAIALINAAAGLTIEEAVQRLKGVIFAQQLETRRWSSENPSTTNIPKQREPDAAKPNDTPARSLQFPLYMNDSPFADSLYDQDGRVATMAGFKGKELVKYANDGWAAREALNAIRQELSHNKTALFHSENDRQHLLDKVTELNSQLAAATSQRGEAAAENTIKWQRDRDYWRDRARQAEAKIDELRGDRVEQAKLAQKLGDIVGVQSTCNTLTTALVDRVDACNDERIGWKRLVNDAEKATGMVSTATSPESNILVDWCRQARRELDKSAELQRDIDDWRAKAESRAEQLDSMIKGGAVQSRLVCRLAERLGLTSTYYALTDDLVAKVDALALERFGWKKLVNDAERAIGMTSFASVPEARSLVEWCDQAKEFLNTLASLKADLAHQTHRADEHYADLKALRGQHAELKENLDIQTARAEGLYTKIQEQRATIDGQRITIDKLREEVAHETTRATEYNKLLSIRADEIDKLRVTIDNLRRDLCSETARAEGMHECSLANHRLYLDALAEAVRIRDEADKVKAQHKEDPYDPRVSEVEAMLKKSVVASGFYIFWDGTCQLIHVRGDNHDGRRFDVVGRLRKLSDKLAVAEAKIATTSAEIQEAVAVVVEHAQKEGA